MPCTRTKLGDVVSRTQLPDGFFGDARSGFAASAVLANCFTRRPAESAGEARILSRHVRCLPQRHVVCGSSNHIRNCGTFIFSVLQGEEDNA